MVGRLILDQITFCDIRTQCEFDFTGIVNT